MTIPLSTKVLHGFYVAYARWVAVGAREGGVFVRNEGLCGNLNRWVGHTHTEDFCQISRSATRVLRDQFSAAGLDKIYPFSMQPLDYDRESAVFNSHRNQDRIHWVYDRLQDMVDATPPTYSLYARMGVDYDWTLCRMHLKEEEVATAMEYYLKTFRHVEAREEIR